MVAAKGAGPGNGNAQNGSAGYSLLLSAFAFHGFQAAAIEFQQLGHVLLRLGRGSAAEAGGGHGGATHAGCGGHKFQQIECDVFIASGAEARAVECVHPEKFSEKDATRKRRGANPGGRIQACFPGARLLFAFEQALTISDRCNQLSNCRNPRRRLRIEMLACDRNGERIAIISPRSRPWRSEMQMLFYDLRFALRQLRKNPGLALLAIFTLALGVGANTAIFTVIENVLLRPLPYANANRLIYIGPGGDTPGFGTTSWLNYRDIRAQSKLLTDAAGYSEDVTVLESRDGSQSVVAPRVTTNLFSMLGAHPLLGRTFSQAEGQTGRSGGRAAVGRLVETEFSRRSQHRGKDGEN